MKRGGPLRRSGGLRRGTWKPPTKRLKQTTKRKADPDLMRAFYRDVLEPTDSQGFIVGMPCASCGGHAIDPHHVLPKRFLYDLGDMLRWESAQVQHLVWDARNGMPLCRGCHDMHERAMRRLPQALIKPATWDFIDAIDELAAGTARAFIERTYA